MWLYFPNLFIIQFILIYDWINYCATVQVEIASSSSSNPKRRLSFTSSNPKPINQLTHSLNYFDSKNKPKITIPTHIINLEQHASNKTGTKYQVGGIGLVSSSQKHINLESFKTSKPQLDKLPLRKSVIETKIKVQKPEWPLKSNFKPLNKVNMRIMGQSVDPVIVNHLHPVVTFHKAKKLRKILSYNLDRLWTSETAPRTLRQRGVSLHQRDTTIESKKIDIQLKEYVNKLNFTFSNLFGNQYELTDVQLNPFRQWLLNLASCDMDYVWEDLGPLFWPRWIRRGVCISKPSQSCSWPPGMKCRPSGSRALHLLHWKCEESIQSNMDFKNNSSQSLRHKPLAFNQFHTGFYDMVPEQPNRRLRRDTSFTQINLKNYMSKLNYPRSERRYNFIHSNPLWSHNKPESRQIMNTFLNKEEKHKRRVRRLIKRLSVTANGYHCYWQVQKYLINDRCSCLCS